MTSESNEYNQLKNANKNGNNFIEVNNSVIIV